MAKRDLYPAGIWVGVLLLHLALVWGAAALWTRENVATPDIQWVQAVPRDASASAATAATPRPLPPSATAPAPAQSPAVKPDPRPEPLPGRPVTEATAPHDGRSEARATEGRASESTPMGLNAPASPLSAARQASADLTPLSQWASHLNNPPPPYPAISRRLGEQGRVVVRVYIDEQGMPKEAHLEVKSGYSRLDTAALEAVMSWRYVPAKRAGVPLAMWFNVPVTFDLKSNKE